MQVVCIPETEASFRADVSKDELNALPILTIGDVGVAVVVITSPVEAKKCLDQVMQECMGHLALWGRGHGSGNETAAEQGCPAMGVVGLDVEHRRNRKGISFEPPTVIQVLSSRIAMVLVFQSAVHGRTVLVQA
jgi:hypothetical protein